MLPAKVAELLVTADAAPVDTVGGLLLPNPLAATLIALAPAPLIAIFPSYDCDAVGLN